MSSLDVIERRGAQTFKWATNVFNFGLLTVGLDHVTLGRVHLLRLVMGQLRLETPNPDLLQASDHLNAAIGQIREANQADFLSRALLPLAWLHALTGAWDASRQRLDEAFALATRGGNARNNWQGGMRLHLIDTLLHRARLFGNTDYPWPSRTPQIDLDEAAALIDICGYHRRDEELADARRALAGR